MNDVLTENHIHEARIRNALDEFFGTDTRGHLSVAETLLERAEGHGNPKMFCRRMADRADEMYEDGVFILLGEENGSLKVKAYADKEIAIAEPGTHLEHYRDVVIAEQADIDIPDFDVTSDLPAPFGAEEYTLDMTRRDYRKIRNNGVIGPGTSDYHNRIDHSTEDYRSQDESTR